MAHGCRDGFAALLEPSVSSELTKKYLSKAELVAVTGLSKATIQRLKDQGRLPVLQPAGKGGRLLFPLDAVERAHAEHQRPPQSAQLAGRRPQWMTVATSHPEGGDFVNAQKA